MELAIGGSLHSLIDSNVDLSNDDIWLVLAQLALGLDHLHANNVLHRDIKPDNILLFSLKPPYRVKYCDFGSSKRVDLSLAKTVAGTFQYMAPEVLAIYHGLVDPKVAPNYTAQADLWSLGVVLYKLVYKRLPFPTPADALKRSLDLISEGEFDGIIRSLLMKDPGQRLCIKKLLNHPKVVQVINDYLLDVDLDSVIVSRYKVNELEKRVATQEAKIERLEDEISQIRQLLIGKSDLHTIEEFKNLIVEKSNKVEKSLVGVEKTLALHEKTIQNYQEWKPLIEEFVGFGGEESLPRFDLSISKPVNSPSVEVLSGNNYQLKRTNLEENNKQINGDVLQSENSKLKLIVDKHAEIIRRAEEEEAREIKLKQEREAKEAEQRRTAELAKQQALEAQLNQEFINKGGVKFLASNKGSRLTLSENDLLVTKTGGNWSDVNSFIQINHPVKGKVVLTLGYFCSYYNLDTRIGLFDPSHCQASNCSNNAHALYVCSCGTQFYVKNSDKGLSNPRGISVGQQIVIDFNNDQVTFSVPSLG
ncbi:hypothetical protein RCL1_002683 [Eukaryota sp. TZLM3-RCL]